MTEAFSRARTRACCMAAVRSASSRMRATRPPRASCGSRSSRASARVRRAAVRRSGPVREDRRTRVRRGGPARPAQRADQRHPARAAQRARHGGVRRDVHAPAPARCVEGERRAAARHGQPRQQAAASDVQPRRALLSRRARRAIAKGRGRRAALSARGTRSCGAAGRATSRPSPARRAATCSRRCACRWRGTPTARRSPGRSSCAGATCPRARRRSRSTAQASTPSTPLALGAYLPGHARHARCATRDARRRDDDWRDPSGAQPVPSDDWAWGDCTSTPFPGVRDSTKICLRGGADPALLYQLVYTARDPLVLLLGFAAVRDVGSFFRYEARDASGTPNPLAGTIRSVIAMGESQAGNTQRTFIHYGFNEDDSGTEGRIVWDGANPHIAARQNPVNLRFARPGGAAGLYDPGSDAIIWWERYADTVRVVGPPACSTDAARRARARRSSRRSARPSSGDCARRRASSAPAATRDIPLPPNVRRYYIASTTHGGGNGAFTRHRRGAARCARCRTTRRRKRSTNARSLAALTAWVTRGTPPPPSRYPRIADGTLTTPDDVARRFPRISGTRPSPAGMLLPIPRLRLRPVVRAERHARRTRLGAAACAARDPVARAADRLRRQRARRHQVAARRQPARHVHGLEPHGERLRQGAAVRLLAADSSHSPRRAPNGARAETRARRSRSATARTTRTCARCGRRRGGSCASGCCSRRTRIASSPPPNRATCSGRQEPSGHDSGRVQRVSLFSRIMAAEQHADGTFGAPRTLPAPHPLFDTHAHARPLDAPGAGPRRYHPTLRPEH